MDCDISLHGANSITLDGTDCVVQAVRAYHNGCGGIHMYGGDQVCMSMHAYSFITMNFYCSTIPK